MSKDKIPYWELLQDPRWQKKRLEIFTRDKFSCVECKDDESPLHVHHDYYVSGRNPWQYPNWSLKTLCKSCHKEAHDRHVELAGKGVEEEDIYEWEVMLGWLAPHPDDISGLWYILAEIAQARGDGIPLLEIQAAVHAMKRPTK